MEQSILVRVVREGSDTPESIHLSPILLSHWYAFTRGADLANDEFHYAGPDSQEWVGDEVAFDRFARYALEAGEAVVFTGPAASGTIMMDALMSPMEDDVPTFEWNCVVPPPRLQLPPSIDCSESRPSSPMDDEYGNGDGNCEDLMPQNFVSHRAIANGTFGAENRITGTAVVIKSMVLENLEEIEGGERELDLLNRCRGTQFIVQFLGRMVERPSVMLVFEWMDGGSLDRFGALASSVLSRVATSILGALAFLHSSEPPILHRDLKRDNVLVSSRGEFKLADLGVSRQLRKDEDSCAMAAETYCGAQPYMAPERINGLSYNTPADIWAYGVLLFEGATGRYPFIRDGEALPRDAEVAKQRLIAGDVPFHEIIARGHGEDCAGLVRQTTLSCPTARASIDALGGDSYLRRSVHASKEEASQWIRAQMEEIAAAWPMKQL